MRRLPIVLLAACGGLGSQYKTARMEYMPSPVAANTEDYHDWGKNPWIDASKDHLSTFAADVDTASYTIARRKITDGELPPAASVRVEEWVNYFHYNFAPATGTPFSVAMEAAPEPFAADQYIVRVGVATNEITAAERKPAHLVFLVDVSGSMDEPTKLPWVKKSLAYLTEHLKAGDTVSIVTYAGGVRLVLPPTGMDHRDKIVAALDDLKANGSTAMASGIDLAYEQAMDGLQPGTTARVIVCTDGDANVGPSSHDEILKIIESRAKAGITLSTIGFGMGNYKDTLMEQLADKGNGNNYYIDSLETADDLFGRKLASTIEVVAKDVKLQVDFDPNVVSKYRLIGYENRDVKDEQFRDDKVGGGQVGPGHQVTAMYEVQLKAKLLPLGLVRIRAKAPDGDAAAEHTYAMQAAPVAAFEQASADTRFAFAVAAAADVLRANPDAAKWSWDEIRGIAEHAAGDALDRREFLALLDRVAGMRGAKVAQ
jgi:Ca-activated chloride channel homolog